MKNQFALNSNRLRAHIFCITLLSLACAGVVASAENETIWSATQQTPAAEKTVGQVQKNIQVLKGLPQTQLLPVMNFMSVSLGVRCNFCHVNKDGNWDFASDEKGEKKAAREMITMVLGINKNNFRGNTEVSCYTCHRGRPSPQSVPQLPLPEVTPRPAAPEGGPRETLPTADQILEKYLEAVGGNTAIDRSKTRVIKGSWIGS